MISLILFTIVILIYCNGIRFLELKHNATMYYTWKEYWFNMAGLAYTVNIVILAIIFIVIQYFN